MKLKDSIHASIPQELANLVARGWAREGKPLEARIHREDQMLTSLRAQGRTDSDAIQDYFAIGYKAFAMFDDVLAWRGRRWSDVGRMLDFASGYGRVTRFFVQTEARSGLYVSDILKDAVEYQCGTFGVKGFASDYDPDKVSLPGPFDLITVVSLFSHLPADTFGVWLRKLASALAPGGLLGISTHGAWAHQNAHGKPMAGDLVFQPVSESKRLDPNLYGTTYCSESYVRRQMADLGDFRVIAFVPRGLNDYQDLYVIERGNAPAPAGPLRLRKVPRLAVDFARIGSDGGFECAGWAVQGTDGQPARAVELLLGERSLGSVVPDFPRPELPSALGAPASARSGFVFRAGSEALRGDPRWLCARAVDDDGRMTIRLCAFPQEQAVHGAALRDEGPQPWPVDHKAVQWAYRLFLGREPDDEATVQRVARLCRTPRALTAAFLGSPEFEAKRAPVRLPSLDGTEPAMAIANATSPADQQRLFEHIQATWQRLGETEPHWSVVSDEASKQQNIARTKDQFFASGETCVRMLQETLQRCGIDWRKLRTAIEYGCGVGRVTQWLSPHVDVLHAYDISAAHLQLAREHLERSGCRNVELHHVRRLEDLATLPQVDCVYSVLVLQHNPPPIIATILERLLAAVAPGGIGFFQVPTYATGYSFELSRYLAEIGRREPIEMHVLPQPDVFRIVRDARCDVLEVLDDDRWTGGGRHNLSNVFVVQKRA